ncbi:MAG TPA: hypothetical protein DCL44_10335 [Elusimicrobia bacterium]|nr:hypothetical protein [Elusimicrobiota bacterium]
MKFFPGFVLITATLCSGAFAQAPAEAPAFTSKSPVPVYMATEKNLGNYYLYADGGFHADWYIGYNNCWIVKLPPAASLGYSKAYIGAKIGRAKINSWPHSWDKTPIPGKIYMAINQYPKFNSDNMYFLTDSLDLPLEPLPNDYLDAVDSSRWFWAEIPLSRISTKSPNYLAVWASSRYFTSASSSPIIAAAFSEDKEEDAWLNRSIMGNPPSGADVLETPISGLKPALAIKLVPQNEYKVFVKGFMAEIDAKKITVSFAAIGEDIRAAWLEVSYDKFDWQRATRLLLRSPYFWTFRRDEVSRDMFYLRAAATDNLENTGYSKEIVIPAIQGPAQ